MKNFNFVIAILFLLIFLPIVSADDFFDTYSGADNYWDGQKAITNKEFEDAIDTLQAKQKKKEARQKKRKIKKISGGGTSLHSGLDPMSEIHEQETLKCDKEEGQLLNIPVDIVIDGNILDKGFYNVYIEEDNEKNVYIAFYQSQFLKGKVKAYTTQDDFGAETLDFVKYIPYNEDYIKIVAGSLKHNAYTYVKYIQPD